MEIGGKKRKNTSKADASGKRNTEEIVVTMEYRLDLNTLLLMLRQNTGKLYSEVQHITGIRGRCQVFLHLEKGLIKSCLIKNARGQEVATGEGAIKLIQDQVLEWQYTEELAPHEDYPQPAPTRVGSAQSPREAPPRSESTLVITSPVPSRTYPPVPQRDFLLWPRLYRAVYSLIDGKTSVDDIARMLTREQSKEQVLEVIAHLQREGLIVFHRRQATRRL